MVFLLPVFCFRIHQPEKLAHSDASGLMFLFTTRLFA